MQLLGRDDLSLDDPDSVSRNWETYLDEFTVTSNDDALSVGSTKAGWLQR
jgi:hypothetical protein